MYRFHLYIISYLQNLHASKCTFCSMYFVMCFFHTQLVDGEMPSCRETQAGWNHQLLKCGGGEIAANHGKSWSSPWRRWIPCLHDVEGQMGEGQTMNSCEVSKYTEATCWFWEKQLCLGIEIMNWVPKVWLLPLFSEQCRSSLWGSQCHQLQGQKAPKDLGSRLKIWASNQFDKQWQQSAYNGSFSDSISISHPCYKIVCLIHRSINWSSTGHNMSNCIFRKLHVAEQNVWTPPKRRRGRLCT